MIVQLPTWLRRMTVRRSGTRRRRAATAHMAQSLESRTMLAGNVTAVVEDGNLRLTGDEADNSVEVTVVDGDIVVQGLDDTTINGATDPFVAVADSTTIAGDLVSLLGNGADTLRITGPLTISGSTQITDTVGATQAGLTDVTADGAVRIVTGHADDDISITGSTLGSSLSIRAGGGDNLISVFNTTVADELSVSSGSDRRGIRGLRLLRRIDRGMIGRLRDRLDDAEGRERLRDRRLRRRGGLGGENDIVIEDSTAGSFSFYTGRGSDSIIVQNSTIEGNVRGKTGSGGDFVMFDGSTVTGHTSVRLRRGDDKLVTQNANTFEGNVFANGGRRRNDAVQISGETVFNGESRFRRFNSSTVSDAMIQMRGTDTLAAAAELRTTLNGLPDNGGNGPALTVDTSMNDDTMDSSGTMVTTLEMFNISGQTDAGATIDVTGGPDGDMDLGSTTADMDGNFSMDVMLPEGANSLMVTSTDNGSSTTEQIDVHRAVGSVVRFESSEGTVDVELLDTDAPITVANFLSYLTDYVNSFIHRAGDGTGGVPSVVQGGGFFLDGTDIEPVATDPAIANEFNAANSNLEGTLSTALSGDGFGGTDPNSATSQWFFNLVDNIFLDAALHTVFGRVIGTGLSVLEAIQNLPTFDIAASVESDPVNGNDPTDALTDVPLSGYDDLSEALPGTVSLTANSVIVTGVGTNFTATLEPGEQVQIDGVTRTVLQVTTDTMLTLTSAPATDITGATLFVNPVPTDDELVLFSSIDVILPAP